MYYISVGWTYRGVGVQVSAHVLNLELQLLLGTLLGSLSCALASTLHPLPSAIVYPYLEGKVLQEVCSAVRLVCLGAASGVDPNTDGRRLGPWGVLGSDLRRGVNCSPDSSQIFWHTVKPFPRVVDSVFAP